jgi:site-specific DNA recombinase
VGAGRWVHKAPIGYISNRTAPGYIEPGEERAPLIRKGFELYASGLSQVKVRQTLANLGFTNPQNGKAVSAQTFDKILKNPIYAGWIEIPSWGLKAAGKFEPIIDAEVFERVQARLFGKPTEQARLRENPDFPLRVFVRCASCGTGLTGSFSKGRTARYPYYFCRVPSCRSVKFRRDHLHRMFIELLESLRLRSESEALFFEVLMDVWRAKKKQHEELGSNARRRLELLEHRKQQLVDALLDHRIDQDTYEDQLQKVRTQLDAAILEASEVLVDETDLRQLTEFAGWMLNNAATLWYGASPENKLRLQRAVLPHGVSVSKEGFGTRLTPEFFSILDASELEKSKLASPRGFEPLLSP